MSDTGSETLRVHARLIPSVRLMKQASFISPNYAGYYQAPHDMQYRLRLVSIDRLIDSIGIPPDSDIWLMTHLWDYSGTPDNPLRGPLRFRTSRGTSRYSHLCLYCVYDHGCKAAQNVTSGSFNVMYANYAALGQGTCIL